MSESTTGARRLKVIALLGGGLAAGAIGATAIGANAQGTAPAASVSSSSSSSTSSPAAADGGTTRPGNGETTVSGTKAATLKAAALAKVPGGTVERVSTETDVAGAAYEVHVTKTDTTKVVVLFNANLSFVSIQTDTHNGHGPGGGRGDETTVTGANAVTLKAAALKQVPGATVEQITTDSGDATYEVHLTKADGSEATVKFDKALKFVNVETGRGK